MKLKAAIFIGLFLVCQTGDMDAYRITIQNALDGALGVTITENEISTPRTVAPGEYFKYDTAGCYILTFSVLSGRAIGQVGGAGTVFDKMCRDYGIITRFLISPTWDPITGKQDLEPKIMEVREQ